MYALVNVRLDKKIGDGFFWPDTKQADDEQRRRRKIETNGV